MTLWSIPLAVVAYAVLLFWVAKEGDRPSVARFADRHQRTIHGLGLAVYCTSWTFYGAVGTASEHGWHFLPIYLGPILLFVVFGRFVQRILQTGRAQHSTSISDFLSSRYGKSAWVAALVTVIALFGALPYMALQLKSVSQTLKALSPDLSALLIGDELVLLVAVAMAAFAILFGTGKLELTTHNRGLALTIALEAVVKFIALGAVALFALLLLLARPSGDLVARQAMESFSISQFDARFLVMTLLSAMAALCLPRQFHMLVVEAREDRLAGASRWLFPAYLILISAAVFPVMLAGSILAPSEISPDMLMIGLPLSFDVQWLAILAFIGGLSASTGMIIVTSIALSNMITNDLIVPAFFREHMRQGSLPQTLGSALINIRRLTVVGLMALAFLYVRAIDRETSLAGLGELAFAGVAQFAPGLLLGLAWRRANSTGMVAGLIAGFSLWLLLLALPVFGLGLQPPLIGQDPFVSGVVLSLACNILMFILFSFVAQPNLTGRVQAVAFVDRGKADLGHPRFSIHIRVADFRLLLEQFVGLDRALEAFNGLRLETGHKYGDAESADELLIERTEQLISSIIGASSARALIQSTLEGDPVPIEQVVAMFDETSQRLQFGADLLQIAIENIDQGISVVDGEQRLVAWNSRYVSMFDYPPELVAVGRSVADLIGYNMRQLGVAEDALENEINKRLSHLRTGSPYNAERELSDGRILRIIGKTAPSGGYVTSYTDITADRKAEQALEAKVTERTGQLTEANAALEAATLSKTKFLAAASHDLVQPMNAARLFASALGEEIGQERRTEHALLSNIDQSIETADRLLRALLDISRLDGGKAQAKPTRFPLDGAFEEIANEFAMQAKKKGIALVVRPCGLWIATDRGLFISVLQNLVTNAVRYSDGGRILVGMRRRGDMAEIFVVDQGRGIAQQDLPRIFDEFTRVGEKREEEGLGLGLAIVRRIAAILGTEILVLSRLGRGSCFRFRLPIVDAEKNITAPQRDMPSAPAQRQRNSIICMDDDDAGLSAITALTKKWGYCITGAKDPQHIRDIAPPGLIIVDYRLENGLTGELAYDLLCERWQVRPPVILLTAEDNSETVAAAERMGARRLIKPPKPAILRALIDGMLK